jgi:hypothetical protein
MTDRGERRAHLTAGVRIKVARRPADRQRSARGSAGDPVLVRVRVRTPGCSSAVDDFDSRRRGQGLTDDANLSTRPASTLASRIEHRRRPCRSIDAHRLLRGTTLGARVRERRRRVPQPKVSRSRSFRDRRRRGSSCWSRSTRPPGHRGVSARSARRREPAPRRLHASGQNEERIAEFEAVRVADDRRGSPPWRPSHEDSPSSIPRARSAYSPSLCEPAGGHDPGRKEGTPHGYDLNLQ